MRAVAVESTARARRAAEQRDAARVGRPRILLVGPQPGGAALGGLKQFAALHRSSMLSEQFECSYFDTDREGVRGPRLVRLAGFTALVARFAWVVATRRPHVVHVLSVSGSHFYQHAILAALAAALRCRVVFNIHGGGFREFYSQQGPAARRLADRFLLSMPVVMCTCPVWQRRLRDLLPGLRPVAVANAVEWDLYAPCRVADRSGTTETAVLFIGTTRAETNRHKGLGDLLAAARMLLADGCRVRLLLAGCDLADPGETAAVAELQRAPGAQVEVFGFIDRDRKVELFARAHIFVLPSYVENFPIAVCEAMSAGRPVIATRVGGVPDQIEDGRNGLLCEPGDVGQLAGALRHLVDDPPLRRAMGERNAAVARDHYDTRVVHAAMARIYTELLGEHGIEEVQRDGTACHER